MEEPTWQITITGTGSTVEAKIVYYRNAERMTKLLEKLTGVIEALTSKVESERKT